MFRKNFPFAICAVALTALAAGPATAQQADPASAEVLAIVNPLRQAVGIAPLRYAPELAQAADPEVEKVADRFFGNPANNNSETLKNVEAAGYKSIRLRIVTHLRTGNSAALRQHLTALARSGQSDLLDPNLKDLGAAHRALAKRTPQGQESAEANAIILATRLTPETMQPAGGTPQAPMTVDVDGESLGARLADLIDQQRASYGLKPLKRIAELDHAARGHAQDMAQYGFVGHRGSNGSSYESRVGAMGYRWQSLGEIVAHGYRHPADLVIACLNSPSNRAVILSTRDSQIGIGVGRGSDGTLFWTIVAGRPMR